MSRLLSANFMRLKKDKIFWCCVVFMFGFGVVILSNVSEYSSYDSKLFTLAPIIGLVLSVFCGMFVGTEHADGTIRNKIIVGRPRYLIYLANFITCVFAGFMMCVAYMIPVLAIGLPQFELEKLDAVTVLKLYGILFMMMIALAALFTLITMLCQKKALVVVLCIIGFIALLYAASWFYSELREPEFYNGYYQIDESGVVVTGDNQPNPNYVTGTKREVYQFIVDFLPTGQAIMLTELSLVHTWQLPVYSLIIICALTSGGIFIFKRKDLK